MCFCKCVSVYGCVGVCVCVCVCVYVKVCCFCVFFVFVLRFLCVRFGVSACLFKCLGDFV